MISKELNDKAAFENRDIDDPKSHSAAAAGLQMADRDMRDSWNAHDKEVRQARKKMREQEAQATVEVYQMKMGNASPEAIAEKEVEVDKSSVICAAFAHREFPASDIQKQLRASEGEPSETGRQHPGVAGACV